MRDLTAWNTDTKDTKLLKEIIRLIHSEAEEEIKRLKVENEIASRTLKQTLSESVKLIDQQQMIDDIRKLIQLEIKDGDYEMYNLNEALHIIQRSAE